VTAADPSVRPPKQTVDDTSRPTAPAAGLFHRIITDRSALVLLAQISVAAVALAANVLASRTLQASGRGELALLLQLAYLSSLGIVLGTDRSLVAVYAGMPVRAVARVQVRLLARPAAAALALTVVATWAVPVLGPRDWQLPLLVTALFTVSNAFVRSTRAVAIAGHRQGDFLVATVVEQVLLLAALAGLAVAHVEDVLVWVGAYLVTALGPAGIYLVRWATRPPAPPEDPAGAAAPSPDHLAKLRQIRREGLQLVPSSLANTGMLRLDRILLAAIASTAALGHYASVSTFTELLTWPLLAYADNRTGAWRARHEAGRLAVGRLLLGTGIYLIPGALATGVLTLLALPLLGPSFSDYRGLIVPLVAAAGVLGLSQMVVTLLVARRCNPWASASDTSGFLVSLAAYLTLIPHRGSAGAAWGSLIGYSASLTVGLAALLLPHRALLSPTPRLASPVHARSVRGALSGTALLVTALTGRFTLDRAGFPSLAWLDLRVIGLVAAASLIVVELSLYGGLKGRQPAGWLVAAMFFLGYQILSSAWAPPGADIGPGSVDLVVLALLVVAVYVHVRTWPQTAGRRLLWLIWVAGIVFGLGAFASGPGDQGRYAAFGGGPNVFVRIEVLGLLAVAVLVTTGASKHLLWSTPLLVAGAVMSGSRGGLLAAGIVGLAIVLAARGRTSRIALVVVVATGAVLTLGYQLGLPGAGLIRDRFVDQTLDQGYLSDRPLIFTSAMQLACDHPFTGAGLGAFRQLVGIRLNVEYAHNYPLSVAAEGGGAGLVLLGLAVMLWLRTIWRARPWDRVTAGFVAAAAFVALASLFSGDYYDSRFAWFCAAVAVAGTARPRTARPPGDDPRFVVTGAR
jgi:O-antigen/teichoic acid export membrane protein